MRDRYFPHLEDERAARAVLHEAATRLGLPPALIPDFIGGALHAARWLVEDWMREQAETVSAVRH